jgi:hypothetical protein
MTMPLRSSISVRLTLTISRASARAIARHGLEQRDLVGVERQRERGFQNHDPGGPGAEVAQSRTEQAAIADRALDADVIGHRRRSCGVR